MALIGLSTAVILMDQVTKFWIQSRMTTGESTPVIAGIFHITYILNAGAAFGILENKTWFFIGVALMLIAGVAYIYPRLPADRPFLKLGAGLLTGGAIGNLIDRVLYGYVIDFLDVFYQNWHWPAFNVADSAITIGVMFLLYDGVSTARQSSDGADA